MSYLGIQPAIPEGVLDDNARRDWFERRADQPLSLEQALKWLESFGLFDRPFTLSMADQMIEFKLFDTAIELMRGYIWHNLRSGNFTQAVEVTKKFHQFCISQNLSPRDLILDDALNDYLPKLPVRHTQSDKLKIGYLVPNAWDVKSTLPSLPIHFASQHSADVSPYVLIPISKKIVEQHNPNLVCYLDALPSFITVIYHDEDCTQDWLRIESFARHIASLGLDSLIFLLCVFPEGLISFMRPARKIFSIDAGHPNWYGHRYIDYIFASHPHFHLEAKAPSEYVPIGFARHEPEPIAPLPEIRFSHPQDTVLFTSGSVDKFDNSDFWELVNAVFQNTAVNWIFLGLEPHIVLGQIQPEFHHRAHAYDRHPNFQHFLKHADLVVDTFPIGGGYTILEAFQNHIPCALYRHDFSKPFDKRANYAPYSHVCPELDFASTPDISAFKDHILSLATSSARRTQQVLWQDEAAPDILSSTPLIRRIEAKTGE